MIKLDFTLSKSKMTDKLSFGKLKGKTLRDAIAEDPNYIEWCANNIDSFILDDECIAWGQKQMAIAKVTKRDDLKVLKQKIHRAARRFHKKREAEWTSRV